MHRRHSAEASKWIVIGERVKTIHDEFHNNSLSGKLLKIFLISEKLPNEYTLTKYEMLSGLMLIES